MNKFKKILLTIKMLCKKPSLINLIIGSNYRWDEYLLKKHPKTTSLPIVPLEELIPNFNKHLNTFSFLGGGSLPTDIMLLKGLCAKIPNCNYFEIGTWRGESIVNIAEVAKECFTLNLSKQDIYDLKMPKKYADLHGFFSKGKENITHLFGNSLTYDFKGLNKKFDVIFIDGNHTYNFVKNDTEKVFKHLLKAESIVVWHDYAYHPEKVRSEVLAGILDGIPKHFKENLYHVSNTMCAIYINKELKTSVPDFPLKPEKTFKISLKINASTF
ncbi:MAG: putative O-methyltransferase YrrM [Polaribacter sp.]|jgi:predicted O-methyltransferase YrrM